MFQSFLYSSHGDSLQAKNLPDDLKKKRQKLLERCNHDTKNFICIRVNKGEKSGKIKNWNKSAFYYAIEKQSTLAQLMIKMSQSLQLESKVGLFFYCSGKMLRPDIQFSQLQSHISKEDGFLHITAELQAAYG